MFRRLISFVVPKNDVIPVIDGLSPYGTIRVSARKDGKNYTVSLYCEGNNMRKFMDEVLTLTREGIMIYGMDIHLRL